MVRTVVTMCNCVEYVLREITMLLPIISSVEALQQTSVQSKEYFASSFCTNAAHRHIAARVQKKSRKVKKIFSFAVIDTSVTRARHTSFLRTMASSKRDIVTALKELVAPEESFRETFNGALPESQQAWSVWEKRAGVDRLQSEHAFHMHTLVDGFQTTQHLNDKYATGVEGERPVYRQNTWGKARESYVKSVHKLSFDHIGLNDAHTLVLAFDNRHAVSPAKRATQVSRRTATLGAASRANHSVYYDGPPDEIECLSIHDDERIEESWRVQCMCFRFRREMDRFLLDPLLRVRSKYLVNNEFSESYVWYDGKMYEPRVRTATSEDGSWHENDAMTQTYNTIGEYDFFCLRYMVNTIEDVIAERRADCGLAPDAGTPSEHLHAQVYNLSNMAFRLVSTDTDMLLYSLWALEHLQVRHRLRMADLPAIFWMSPWNSSSKHGGAFIWSVTHLYELLRHKLTYLHSRAGFSIRTLCTSFFAWGSDLMPSPHGITPRTALRAFTLLNPLLVLGLCAPNPMCAEATAVNGSMLRMLFILWYGTKHLWSKTLLGKSIDYESVKELVESLRERFMDRTIGEFEDFVSRALQGKEASERKRSLAAANQMPSYESRVVEHRIGLLQYTIFCVEHALKVLPAECDQSLYDIGLIGPGNGDDTYYVDMHGHFEELLSTRQKRLLSSLGLFGRGKYFRFNDALMQKGAQEYSEARKRDDIKRLAECAEKVFYWPQLDK